MAFNATENIVYSPNPALSIGTGPIASDSSSVSEVTYSFQTNTAAVVGGLINGNQEPQNYNGVETLFDVRIPSSSRVLFNKSYLKVSGFACNMNTGVSTGVPVGTSIPWNSIAALLDTAEVQLNQTATTTEQINQNLGDGSMAKILTRYSRDTIETMSDQFFTPCLEETRDTRGGIFVPLPPMEGPKIPLPVSKGKFKPKRRLQAPPITSIPNLSVVSMTRREKQLVAETTTFVQQHSKNLYLADIFDSLKIPAAFFLQNIQFKFRPKQAANILFEDNIYINTEGNPDAGAISRYYVTKMELFLTMVNLTENQMAEDAQKIQQNVSMLRQSFNAYDAIQKPFMVSASYRDSNIKNMQAAIFMFPSSMAWDGAGVNRYQYTYNNPPLDAPPGSTGITAYQMKYDNIYSPAVPTKIEPIQQHKNSDLFFQYRLLTRRTFDREIPTPLSLDESFSGPFTGDYDPSSYVFFCAQFYPQDAFIHRNMAGSDHEIITTGGGNSTVIIVRVRASFVEIRGDTSVYMIN
jgi:hypothetical protein